MLEKVNICHINIDSEFVVRTPVLKVSSSFVHNFIHKFNVMGINVKDGIIFFKVLRVILLRWWMGKST